MNTKLLCSSLCVILFHSITFTIQTPTPSPTHEFYGKHFIANYENCDSNALQNIDSLLETFKEAVQASGETILKCDHELFLGNGLTAFFVLSESHASIHTYPEHRACFIDLFACGRHCSYKKFDETLKRYLKPTDVKKKVYIRTSKIPSNQKQKITRAIKSYSLQTKNGARSFIDRFLGKKGYSREEVQWARAKVAATILTTALLAAGLWYWKPWKSRKAATPTGIGGGVIPEGNNQDKDKDNSSNDEEANTDNTDQNSEEPAQPPIAERFKAFKKDLNPQEINLFEKLTPEKQGEQLDKWERPWDSWFGYVERTVTIQ